MKDVTFSIDEETFAAADARARQEQRTLEEVAREWLIEYSRAEQRMADYYETMAKLRGKFRAGRKFSRDEMNAR